MALADYLSILRRRKWLVVMMLVGPVVVVVALSLSQRPVYQATAQVLINRANIATSIMNVTDPSTLGNDPNRFLTTQSDVARSPVLVQRVIAKAGAPRLTVAQLLANSGVTAATNADILNVSVSSPHRTDAVRLANIYAHEYTLFKTELDTARINDALTTLRARTKSLTHRGIPATSPVFATLLQSESQLETVGKLLANNTQVLQQAETANKIRPRTKRNGALAGLLGVVLGIGLALVAEALDRRVRTEREVEETLALPLLARVPRPPKKVAHVDRLVMLTQPRSIEAEPFRKLRANLEFTNLDLHARKILITSALSREGKSTTIANLGVALALAGRKVALVDLDLRRPYLHKFFNVPQAPGVSDVVLHHISPTDVLSTIKVTNSTRTVTAERRRLRAGPSSVREVLAEEIGSSPPGDTVVSNGSDRVSSNGSTRTGVLKLLPAGTPVPDPGEFVGKQRLATLLDELNAEFDYVLVDAAPLLAVGDTTTLSAMADAMFAVTRLGFVPRTVLEEFARQFTTCQSEKLGFVLAGAELEEEYDHGDYHYAYASAGETERAERAAR